MEYTNEFVQLLLGKIQDAYAEAQKDRVFKEAQVQYLESRCAELQEDMDTILKQVEAAEKELQDKNDSCAQQMAEIDRLRQLNDDLLCEINELRYPNFRVSNTVPAIVNTMPHTTFYYSNASPEDKIVTLNEHDEPEHD